MIIIIAIIITIHGDDNNNNNNSTLNQKLEKGSAGGLYVSLTAMFSDKPAYRTLKNVTYL